MRLIEKMIGSVACGLFMSLVAAHESANTATYLGNAAVLVTGTKSKVLFDPFFHSHFNQYQLVPHQIKSAIMQGNAPYDNIDAIVISHAHGDHFAADEVLAYLQTYPATKLIAPQQAVDELAKLDNSQSVMTQVFSVRLALGDKPIKMLVGELIVEAIRIPHSGWPGRADVENILFRIALDGNLTVMHMGDADADDNHFLPYKIFWQERVTDTAFPPYWFFSSAEGNDILDLIINTRNQIGVHVPTKVPGSLRIGTKDYFSKPGETRDVDQSLKKAGK